MTFHAESGDVAAVTDLLSLEKSFIIKKHGYGDDVTSATRIIIGGEEKRNILTR